MANVMHMDYKIVNGKLWFIAVSVNQWMDMRKILGAVSSKRCFSSYSEAIQAFHFSKDRGKKEFGRKELGRKEFGW